MNFIYMRVIQITSNYLFEGSGLLGVILLQWVVAQMRQVNEECVGKEVQPGGIHSSGGSLRVFKYHCDFFDNAWMLAMTLALSKSMNCSSSMQTDHWLFKQVHHMYLENREEMWQPIWLMYTLLHEQGIMNTPVLYNEGWLSLKYLMWGASGSVGFKMVCIISLIACIYNVTNLRFS
jgi:hypothetical protein